MVLNIEQNGGKNVSEAIGSRIKQVTRLLTCFETKSISDELIERRMLQSLLIVNHPLVSSGDFFVWPALVNSLHERLPSIDPIVLCAKHANVLFDTIFKADSLFYEVILIEF